MNEREREALLKIARSLFTASEALREALDTADLENVALEDIQQKSIESQYVALEQMAQNIKRRAGK